MPYTIITRKQFDTTGPRPLDHPADTERAVATLDEAREAAQNAIDNGPPIRSMSDYSDLCSAAMVPESGGTIGPLPDGTIIEVRHVSRNELSAEAGYPTPYFKSTADLIDAFNA